MTAPSHVERGTPAFRKINLAVFSAGYSTFLMMYAVQPLLPIFAEEFHISAAASSLALSLTTGCLAMSMLVVGAVAEGWSRKPVMSVSLLAVALLTILSSVVQEWPPQAQPPQSGRSDFVHLRGSLLDAIAGPDVVKEQI